MGSRQGQFRIKRCAIAGVEAVEADTNYSFGRHTHDQFGVGIILRGAQKSASGRGPVEAGPGDIITVNPGEVHDGHPYDAGGRAWRMLYLDPDVVAAAKRDIDEDALGDFEFSAPVFRDAAAARRWARLYDAMTRSKQTLGPESALLDLVASWMHIRPPSKATRAIRHAQALIDDDPCALITLSDLAAVSGLSRFQVLRAFAAATGATPHAYLLQRRLAAARRLIACGNFLADAATASGFADQSHLTRCFVRAYGMTPGAYAKAFR